MATKDDILRALRQHFEDLKGAERKLYKLNHQKQVDDEIYNRFKRNYEIAINAETNRIYDLLQDCDRFPERFSEHERRKRDFYAEHQGSDFDSSVFIMTKFPKVDEKEADKLQGLIDAITGAIRKQGYFPRIAQGRFFNDWVWSNVEMHLLFCSHGVAVLEDRYLPELNPNVAMEWGWMLGMGRKVIYLREKGFDKERADWIGRGHHEFDWNDPTPGIDRAISTELRARAPT